MTRRDQQGTDRIEQPALHAVRYPPTTAISSATRGASLGGSAPWSAHDRVPDTTGLAAAFRLTRGPLA